MKWHIVMKYQTSRLNQASNYVTVSVIDSFVVDSRSTQSKNRIYRRNTIPVSKHERIGELDSKKNRVLQICSIMLYSCMLVWKESILFTPSTHIFGELLVLYYITIYSLFLISPSKQYFNVLDQDSWLCKQNCRIRVSFAFFWHCNWSLEYKIDYGIIIVSVDCHRIKVVMADYV